MCVVNSERVVAVADADIEHPWGDESREQELLTRAYSRLDMAAPSSHPWVKSLKACVEEARDEKDKSLQALPEYCYGYADGRRYPKQRCTDPIHTKELRLVERCVRVHLYLQQNNVPVQPDE